MKSTFFKSAAALIAAAMLLSLITACAGRKPKAAVDETPEGKPSESPVESASPAPNEEIAVPKIVLTDFSECSEKIAEIKPGEGENELHYSYRDPAGSGYDGGPVSFYAADGKLYFRDPYSYPGELSFRSLFVYDIASGEGSRIKDDPPEEDKLLDFAVSDGRVVTYHGWFDIESEESMGLYPLFRIPHGLFMSDDEGVYILETIANCMFKVRLVDNTEWKAEDKLVETESSVNEWKLWRFADTGISIVTPYQASFICRDENGAYLFLDLYSADESIEVEGEHTQWIIMKYDRSGNLVKACSPTISWVDERIWGDSGRISFACGDDGSFYFAYTFADGVEVYKAKL